MEYAGHTRLTRQGQITLPARLRRQLGLRRGDPLEVYYSGGTVVIRKKAAPLEVFEAVTAKVRGHIRAAGIRRRDVTEAIAAYRRQRPSR